MASTIKLKNGSGQPLASDLVQGEPALDLTNKRLYTEDSLGNVIEVGTNPTSLTTGDITTTGAVDVTGDLDVDNINIDGNTITSTDTDGNIAITPNGTGEVDISKVDIDSGAIDNTVIGGTTTAAGSFTTLQADTSLNVDGTVTADGLTVDADVTTQATAIALNGTSFADEERLSIDFQRGSSEGVRLSLEPDGGQTVGDFVIETGTFGSTSDRLRIEGNGDISFYEDTGTTAKFFWDASAESLGIGTSSPSGLLHLSSSAPAFYMTDTTNNTDGVISMDNAGSLVFNADLNNEASSSNIRFAVDGSEAMRIDSSGNLLVGKTTSGGTTAGMAWLGNEYLQLVNTETGATDRCLLINRQSADGTLIEFRKANSQVGSIGNEDSLGVDSVYLVSALGTGITFGAAAFLPTDADGNISDNTKDLGATSIRFDDIYATNGTIQTSDRNEKQDIEELSEAEQRVAVAAKGLLRKFRWIDSVEEKGDDARIHFGIIAQDLQAAFEAEGLDAGRYAMFIHSTWTDEETGEERSRMGVRYSELLAFIIAAI